VNRWATLSRSIVAHGPCVLVSIVSTRGSVPRGIDAWMIVTANGFHGSIGGGTLEWQAMAEAQAMRGKGGPVRTLDYVLGPDLGQCCGGRVQLSFEVFDETSLQQLDQRAARETRQQRKVYLYGAGHVGRALVLALAPLPFDVMWIDPRPNAFPALAPQNVTMLNAMDITLPLRDAPEHSLALVMSHSHSLDLEVVDAALRNSNVAHVGLIGSATKRARFEKRLSEAGVDPQRIAALICPIGVGGITSKHPAAIAASAAAQLLQLDSRLAQGAQTEIQATGSRH
jgi:xanthine dehydrogenase accessory factor